MCNKTNTVKVMGKQLKNETESKKVENVNTPENEKDVNTKEPVKVVDASGNETKVDDKEISDLIQSGLSKKEAELIVKHRNQRTENVTLRMSQKELETLNVFTKALKERGYIREGKTDCVMWLLNHLPLPEDKQLSIGV